MACASINNSPKFKWSFATYQALMMPSRTCIGVAVGGYFIQSLDYAIDLLMVIGIGRTVTMGMANVI